MKSIIIALLLVSSSLFAAESGCDLNNKQIALNLDKQVTVDVYGIQPVVLVAEIAQSNHESPVAKVTSEYVGFECEVLKVEKKPNSNCWEITVDWSPGADVSGCYISVEHPSLSSDFSAFLYMDYHSH